MILLNCLAVIKISQEMLSDNNTNSTISETTKVINNDNNITTEITENYLADLIDNRKHVVSQKNNTTESKKAYENDLALEKQVEDDFVKKGARIYSIEYIEKLIEHTPEENYILKNLLITALETVQTKGYSFEVIQELMGLDKNIKKIEKKQPETESFGFWGNIYGFYKKFRG